MCTKNNTSQSHCAGIARHTCHTLAADTSSSGNIKEEPGR